MESIRTVDERGNIHYKNSLGVYHRTDGPAIESPDGYKTWYTNGLRHREDGPARIWSDGEEEYYLNDKKYYKEDYEQEVIKLKLKRIIDL